MTLDSRHDPATKAVVTRVAPAWETSVMTYILPDSTGGFLNRDSDGDRSEIPPGALDITQAGRGIHHDEVPLVTGVGAHGFQIRINHREDDRWVEPRATHANG